MCACAFVCVCVLRYRSPSKVTVGVATLAISLASLHNPRRPEGSNAVCKGTAM